MGEGVVCLQDSALGNGLQGKVRSLDALLGLKIWVYSYDSIYTHL